MVLALFAVAGRNVYRPMEACDPGTACAVPQVRKRRQVIFLVNGTRSASASDQQLLDCLVCLSAAPRIWR